MQLADQIDRRAGLSREQFDREYLQPTSAGDPDRRDFPLGRAWGDGAPSSSRRNTATSRSRSTARRWPWAT